MAPKIARSVEDISILRLPETDSADQVEWQELSLDRHGIGSPRSRTFRGLIKIERATELTPEALAANPLGVLVADFTWTETTRHD